MKRILTLAVVAGVLPGASLVACEGEPPVMAPGNATVDSSSAVASSSASAPEPLSAAPTACPPPPCAAAAAASGLPSPSSSAAAPASAEAALPVPPEPSKRGSISGTVTTQPAALARNAVVYLEEHPGDESPAHQTVRIDNRQMTFAPYISVVAVEGKVVFANDDPFPHNVFSPDNDKFNLGNIPQNGAIQRVFHHAGAYTLLCNLHPGMLGYLLVTPSTHFGRTDAKGKFSMRDVPVGTYNVSAWAPRDKPVTHSVTVTEADVTADFDLHR